MLTDPELLVLNGQGFIPGPQEDEVAFCRRAALSKEAASEGIPRAHWDWVRAHLKRVFDFEPHCISAFYSSKGLAPWQGAATWIEDGKPPAVQLRRGSYFGYDPSEILAHEAVHAARCAFDEPMAEEFFAYMASEKWRRRAFGPVVKKPWEVWVFFGLAALGIVFPWLQLASSAWLGAGVWRLIRLHRTMRLAAKRLAGVVQGAARIRAIMIRLTDAEIVRFAKGDDILAYAGSQSCLRWRLIRLAYFDKLVSEVNHGSEDRR